MRPDWQPYAFAVGAGIAVALIVSVAASFWIGKSDRAPNPLTHQKPAQVPEPQFQSAER
jgi:hypothetical protein